MDKKDWLAEIVFNEYTMSQTNKTISNADFEGALDLLDGIPTENQYKGMSNINIPEYPSILLTECSSWGNQYFPTRDFVNIYLEGDTVEDQVKSKVAKTIINKTLNSKDIHHFHKYIRTRLINALDSKVLIVCMWEKEILTVKKGDIEVPFYDTEKDKLSIKNEEIIEHIIVKDRFNYEPIDPRNWFCSNEYVYSIQDKEWVTIRSEVRYSDIKGNKKYINADKLNDFYKATDNETATSKETYNQDLGDKETKINEMKNPKCDKLTRFGKVWVIVKEKEENGYPLKVESGFNEDGSIMDNAEYVECVIEELVKNNQKLLIRLTPQFCHDRNYKAYRPMVRGLNYIHPVKDVGMNDAKYCKDLSIMVNDTINMSNSRVSMATFPPIIANEYAVADNSTLVWGPGQVMTVPDVNQMREFEMKTDIQGALSQASVGSNKMYQITGIYPPQMGGLPGYASTTATASAGAEANANMRSNYKSMTVEHTLLNPFYWMILNLTYQFAEIETIKKMVGENIMDWFDPDADYTFQPISSNIELEYNKKNNLNFIMQLFGMVMKVPNPNTPKVLNKLMIMAAENMSKEFRQVSELMLDEEAPQPPSDGGEQAGATSMGGGAMGGNSNQNGVPMSGQEIMAREGVNQ